MIDVEPGITVTDTRRIDVSPKEFVKLLRAGGLCIPDKAIISMSSKGGYLRLVDEPGAKLTIEFRV